MTQQNLLAFEQWLDRVEQTLVRLLADRAHGLNVEREIAEYRKLLARAMRALDYITE